MLALIDGVSGPCGVFSMGSSPTKPTLTPADPFYNGSVQLRGLILL